jgi:hypothetical protein
MWSADHFDKEVKCGMTDLSLILEQCSDTIFKVQFKKKINEKEVEEKLAKVKPADLKKADVVKKLSKDIIEGESVEITGHLVESDNNLGRSLIIDLNAPMASNFRQVDHRTIEYIIYRNVKYTLGKKAASSDEFPLKYDKNAVKWTSSNLAVGNWFSSVSYYKVKSITDKDNCQVVTPQSSAELMMSRDIMEYEMNSS